MAQNHMVCQISPYHISNVQEETLNHRWELVLPTKLEGEKERIHSELLSPVWLHHGSPQGDYGYKCIPQSWNPTMAASYRRQEQVRKRENDRGYRDRRLERVEKCGSDAQIGMHPRQTAWVTVWLWWGHLLRVYTNSQTHKHTELVDTTRLFLPPTQTHCLCLWEHLLQRD